MFHLSKEVFESAVTLLGKAYLVCDQQLLSFIISGSSSLTLPQVSVCLCRLPRHQSLLSLTASLFNYFNKMPTIITLFQRLLSFQPTGTDTGQVSFLTPILEYVIYDPNPQVSIAPSLPRYYLLLSLPHLKPSHTHPRKSLIYINVESGQPTVLPLFVPPVACDQVITLRTVTAFIQGTSA